MIEPGHPIAEGIDEYSELEHEMYGEDLIFHSRHSCIPGMVPGRRSFQAGAVIIEEMEKYFTSSQVMRHILYIMMKKY